jgi:hypothetical protein
MITFQRLLAACIAVLLTAFILGSILAWLVFLLYVLTQGAT